MEPTYNQASTVICVLTHISTLITETGRVPKILVYFDQLMKLSVREHLNEFSRCEIFKARTVTSSQNDTSSFFLAWLDSP